MSEEQIEETKTEVVTEAPLKPVKKKSSPKKVKKVSKPVQKKAAPKKPAKKKKVSKPKPKAKLKAKAKRSKSVHSVLMHKSLVKPSRPEKVVMNFKVDSLEQSQIRKVAQRYTKGNVTALIRLAVLSFKPKKSDLVTVRASTRK